MIIGKGRERKMTVKGPLYSDEKNVQVVIALLKAHGICRIVVSPGATNISFVGSVQGDSFFKLYSAVDERHAAYLACGIAQETGEPTVINCTGATSSRNYLPGLTEAYYRRLPILAITSSQLDSHRGQLWAQMTDRTSPPSDSVRHHVDIGPIKDEADFCTCERLVNEALLELRRHGGGPVHINLQTTYSLIYNTSSLPRVRKMSRVQAWSDVWPELGGERIAVFIGAHFRFSKQDKHSLERFVRTHNAVVFCDKTSSYDGYGRIDPSLLGVQIGSLIQVEMVPEILIHIGEVSGDYSSFGIARMAEETWRVSEDGEIRDFFGNLKNVFEMPERLFFDHYSSGKEEISSSIYMTWQRVDKNLRERMPANMPFSNAWIAGRLNQKIPSGACVYLGILNTLRVWNDFPLQQDIETFSNVGGFGIDGGLSTLIGASLVNPNRLYYAIVGDLSFFYDMNSLGNRHIGPNIRILLINNGTGGEFNLYSHASGRLFGENVNKYIAAGGHFGQQSKELVRHYVTDLGFRYLSATTKDEFVEVENDFTSPQILSPVLLECFIDVHKDSEGVRALHSIVKPQLSLTSMLSSALSPEVKTIIKKVLNR